MTKLQEDALKAASICSRTGFAGGRLTVGLGGGATLDATGEHPFRDTTISDTLLTADGHRAMASSTNTGSPKLVAYHVTVADPHTYNVLADNGGIDLSNATEVRGRFPVGGALDAGGPANGILYRTQNGVISNYAVYDADGVILRRIDLVGAAHGGVPTPHVQEFTRNVAPDGRIFPQQSKIATPAGPGDLPRIVC